VRVIICDVVNGTAAAAAAGGEAAAVVLELSQVMCVGVNVLRTDVVQVCIVVLETTQQVDSVTVGYQQVDSTNTHRH